MELNLCSIWSFSKIILIEIFIEILLLKFLLKFFYWLENYKSELLCPLYQVFFVIFYARDSRRYSNNCIIAFFLLRRIKKNVFSSEKNAARENADGVGYAFIVCYDLTTNSVFYSTCTRGGAKQSLRTTAETESPRSTSAMD